ncbi:MAG: hypothetical protein HJJLKODD_01232 [Phycisphaerae bacterium]|nr:hypothetical protein [Phycisphaerae bacterium]
MSRWLTITLLSCLSFTACQPLTNPSATTSARSAAQQFPFPADWTGHWRGPLTARFPSGRAQTYLMELQIAPTADPLIWSWKIIYGQGEQRQLRDYELQIVNAEAGEYRIDEKNSILIPAGLVQDQLVSLYSVMDAIMTARYERTPQGIVFTLESYRFGNPVISGGIGEIPPVTTYPLTVVQHALLQKAVENKQ